MRKENNLKGNIAELEFLCATNKLGMITSQPFGNQVYDFIVDTDKGLSRVQVKSCNTSSPNGRNGNGKRYKVMVTRGATIRRYSSSEIDFLVAYVVPENEWYIIPAAEIENQYSIVLFPHLLRSTGKFEKYKNAWNLL